MRLTVIVLASVLGLSAFARQNVNRVAPQKFFFACGSPERNGETRLGVSNSVACIGATVNNVVNLTECQLGAKVVAPGAEIKYTQLNQIRQNSKAAKFATVKGAEMAAVVMVNKTKMTAEIFWQDRSHSNCEASN